MKTKRLAGLAGALAIGLIMQTGAPGVANAQMQDRTLRVGAWDLAPSKGNPYFGIGTPSVFSWSPMFDSLTFVETDGSATPALATSWENLNPTTWRFKLRPDIRFHNGETLSAEAIINSWAWLQTEEGLVGKQPYEVY